MLKPHHLGIVVKNLDKAAKFYEEYLGFERVSKVFTVDDPDYGVRYVFVNANGILLELLEPIRGPWVERLAQRGEGAIWEICFAVDSVEEMYDKFKAKGITLEDRFGRPLIKQKYVHNVTSTGNKFAYVPAEAAFGTWIELLEQCGTKLVP
ncbi:MAG: VOC family protein [Bacillota bacterium]|nr:VOC family protein [Bacillota bacterium]